MTSFGAVGVAVASAVMCIAIPALGADRTIPDPKVTINGRQVSVDVCANIGNDNACGGEGSQLAADAVCRGYGASTARLDDSDTQDVKPLQPGQPEMQAAHLMTTKGPTGKIISERWELKPTWQIWKVVICNVP